MIISDYMLLAVFGILFLIESILPAGRGTVIVYSHLLNRWAYTISSSLPIFGGRHLFLKTLFPPLGASFITGSNPVVLSPSGIMLNPYEGRFSAVGRGHLAFTEIGRVGVSGSALMINDKKFCTMHSEYEAEWWKDRILETMRTSASDRPAVIKRILLLMFDVDVIREIAETVSGKTKHLRIAVNTLYIYLFFIVPLSVVLFSIDTVILPLLCILFLLQAVSISLFSRAYIRVFSERRKPWGVIISTALYPPALIRSIDYFFRDSLIMFNPAAVSLCMMNMADAEALASFLIREYKYYRFTSGDAYEREICSIHREAMLDQVKRLLEINSIDYNAVITPPEQYDDMASYCPRCHCQYSSRALICGDCSIDLVKY